MALSARTSLLSIALIATGLVASPGALATASCPSAQITSPGPGLLFTAGDGSAPVDWTIHLCSVSEYTVELRDSNNALLDSVIATTDCADHGDVSGALTLTSSYAGSAQVRLLADRCNSTSTNHIVLITLVAVVV